jgi:osmotically-inducible protein OsmY
VKTDVELERDVREEILYDARIEVPGDVAIWVDEGLVTLRGWVGTFREKRAAERAARRVAGVTMVDNRLAARVIGRAT